MDKCIFCKKQTTNEYSYYMADKAHDERYKVTVFACTKCFRKTSVIILSIISFFFLLSLVINISEIISGKKPMEPGGLITMSILVLGLLFWTFYIMYRIKIDTPLSETSAAKKLIKRAKKVSPSKFYFTPAENALLTTKDEKKTDKSLQTSEDKKQIDNTFLTLENEIRNSFNKGEEIVIAESVKVLIQLYGSSPKGEGFLIDSNAAIPVRKIGALLNDIGGFSLMLATHEQFAAAYHVMGAARNLEMVWGGIGSWQG